MNIQILLWLQDIRMNILDVIFESITLLAEDKNFFLILAFVFWCYNKATAVYMGFGLTYSGLFVTFVKCLARVPRPWLRDKRLKPVASAKAGATGFSMPSGHTSQAFAIYGGFAHHSKSSRILNYLSWLLFILIAFSRIYLGVHTPGDVIAALLIGLICFTVMEKVLFWVDKEENRDWILVIVTLLLCFGVVSLCFTKPYDQADTGLAADMYKSYMDLIKKVTMLILFLASWMMERRKINYQKCENHRILGIQTCVGLVFIFWLTRYGKDFIYTLFVNCIGKYWGKIFARSFVNGFVILFIYALYPALMMAWNKRTRKQYEK